MPKSGKPENRVIEWCMKVMKDYIRFFKPSPFNEQFPSKYPDAPHPLESIPGIIRRLHMNKMMGTIVILRKNFVLNRAFNNR
jgi:hypothetical protein